MPRTTKPTSITIDESMRALLAVWGEYLSQRRAGAVVSRSDVIRYLAKSTPLPKDANGLALAVRNAYDACFGDQ